MARDGLLHKVKMMKAFTAPWSKSLIVMSSLATLLCLGITFGLLPHTRGINAGPLRWVDLLPAAMVPTCALFAIRGYVITPDAILVRRLLWATRLPRAGLQSASFEPDAMRRSLRTCGNGGFFSFTGFYWNKTMRSYRAFVTDPRRAVVLRYERRTIVVSPGEPEEFVRELGGPGRRFGVTVGKDSS